MALVGVLWMFIPEGRDGPWLEAMQGWDPERLMELPYLIVLTVSVCIMIAMSLTDLFVTGAGFGIYINNRTWVEGWDVELALKRLAKRLTKVVPLALFGWFLLAPGMAMAEVEAEPAKVIQEVKAAPEFKVHKVTDRVPIPRAGSWNWLERFFRWLGLGSGGGSGAGFGGLDLMGKIFVISLAGIVLGVIIWLIWINRHAFIFQSSGSEASAERETARVVMGMDVSPETLPADVPSAAWALWGRGLHQEALGLLYRGAISRVIEISRVEIQESDTENDCVRRVAAAGTAAHPEYFRGITGVWVHLAYAGRLPEEAEVASLCRNWPFAERRNA
jgi:hypothetical protein